MAVMSTTLGKACTLKAGKFVAANDIADEYRDGLFPCYGGNGIRGYVTEYSHEGEYPLIGRQGALCGNVNFASGKFRATEHAVVVQPNVQMHIRWLYYKLLSMDLGQYATGAAQPGLAVAKLEQLPFVMPSLEEQERLSTLCDQVEVLISLRKQQIAKLDELVKARFVEMFGEQEYPVIEFGDVCDFLRNGANIKQTKGAGGYPITRIETLANDRFNADRLGYADIHDLNKYSSYILQSGDILISHINSVAYLGRAVQYRGEVSGPVIHGMNLLCARIKEHDATYIEWYLKGDKAKTYIGSITKKAVNQASITTSDLRKLPLMLPPIELQHQFAAFVAQTDKQKLTIQHSLAKLETLKKALMQKYFG